MTQFAKQPTASIPQACGRWPTSKPAYRFFDNNSIDPQTLLEAAPPRRLWRGCRNTMWYWGAGHHLVEHSTHPDPRIGTDQQQQRQTIGLFLHITLALSVTGEPWGFGSCRECSRSLSFGKRRIRQRRNKLPLQDKESHAGCRSPEPLSGSGLRVPLHDAGSMWLTGKGYLRTLCPGIKSSKGSARASAWCVHSIIARWKVPMGFVESIESTAPCRDDADQVPRQPGHRRRTTILRSDFGEMTLCAPCLKEGQPSLKWWAIQARENCPQKGNDDPVAFVDNVAGANVQPRQ